MTKTLYKKIDGNQYDRIFVIGDLHGCYSLLMQKLDEIQFNFEKDLLVSVGDLIDRGPENLKSLNLINEPWFSSVLGNHEMMAIQSELSGGFSYVRFWYANNGGWHNQELDNEENEQFFHQLLKKVKDEIPLVLEINTKNNEKIIVCHASYPHWEYEYNRPFPDDEDVYWDRTQLDFFMISKNPNNFIIGADKFFFGHTIVKEPLTFGNCHYIDTGAFLTGNLTLIQIQ